MLTKLIGGYAATAAEISETGSSNTNQLPQPVANEIGNRGGNPTGNAIASSALPAGLEN